MPRPCPDLKTWRTKLGVNQRQAAKMLGISQTFYSRLERRTQAMRGKQAKAIVAKTGVPLEVLVGAA